MNDEKSKRATLIAGVFVLLGMVLFGSLVFQFGSLRHRLRKPYALYVNFLDAQNLIKGAPVKRAGATIGQVVTSPELVDGLKGVQVKLEIYPEFQIPLGSPLRITSVGVVGDTLLDVGQVPPDKLTGEYIKPDTVIEGTGTPDLMATANKLTDEIMVVLRDLRNGLGDLNVTVGKLNNGVLSEDNLNNFASGLKELRESINKLDNGLMSDANVAAVSDALADFRKAMSKVNEASGRVDGVLNKADSAVGKVDKAMNDLSPALKGTQSAAVNLKQAATALEGLLSDARTGDGLMNALLNDDSLRKDFVSLVTNLKQRGILFYKDKEKSADEDNAKPDKTAKPRTKPWGAR